MLLSTVLQYSDDPLAGAEAAVAMERAGLDVVWVPEAYSFDAVSLMGFLAAKTERVQIGSGILPIYSRTPTLTAMTAAGLDAVSGGRAILGLGTSGPQVVEGFHGVPYDKPVARTREVIEICRSVWRREKVEHQGIYTIPLPAGQGTGLGKPLKIINHLRRAEIPIWVAALGDRNLEMTAELADGWLPILFIPERARDVWGDALDAGTAKRDPALGPLQISAGGMVAIGEDVKGLLDFLRPMYALYVGGMGARGKNFYNELAQHYGYEREAKEIQDLYLDGKKKEAEALVPMEWMEASNLVGPASYVQERIAAFREAGVTSLQVSPVSDDPAATIAQVKEWVS
jgi:F420-dependent oxidoreductase-like protein